MLRLSEIKLPLDHPEDALESAILQRLEITANDLLKFTVARRGFDARKSSHILLVYTLDVEIKNEAPCDIVQDEPVALYLRDPKKSQ